MLALSISALLLALAAPGGPTYRPPRPPAPAETPAAGPEEALPDDEVRARVASYLGTIDVPVSVQQWRALGPRAVPLLEGVLSNPEDLPSRRAAAVAGLSAIGGARARELVVGVVRAGDAPFAVRVAALHGAPRVLGSAQLARELKPVLRGAGDVSIRAAAAEVLARHGPRSACDTVREQVDREGQGRAHFERALQRCASRP